jgi:hypothetical protein
MNTGQAGAPCCELSGCEIMVRSRALEMRQSEEKPDIRIGQIGLAPAPAESHVDARGDQVSMAVAWPTSIRVAVGVPDIRADLVSMGPSAR